MTQPPNGRIKNVRGTLKIKSALELVSKHAALLSFNPEVIFGEYLPVFDNFITMGKVNNILFIDLDEFFDVGFTSLLKKHSKDFFLLADNEAFEKYKNRSTQQIHQSQIINGRIREPDKIFDFVFIVDFHIKENFYGMNEKTLLQEAIRVTKPNGSVIINATQNLPVTNNMILDSMAENLKNNPFMITIEKEEFQEIISSISPNSVNFYNSKGILIAKIEMN